MLALVKLSKNKRCMFTGGGSAGHVTPNLALIKKFQNEGWQLSYIGSHQGIERQLIAKTLVPYFAIFTGKMRRYFSWKNFIDPIKILFGIGQAFFLCRKIKPDLLFSKGGFVAFPVVVAAWLNRIPIITHEADLTIGLANKLCFPFATKICLTFPDTQIAHQYLSKTVVSGLPIREDFFRGDPKLGWQRCGFKANKKTLVVVGGSLGSDVINQVIRASLPKLLPQYQIAHICGEGKIDATYETEEFTGYHQFTFIGADFPHILAAASLVISRAGANSLYEIIALRKPALLIPLSAVASRGDQIANAKYAAKKGLSACLFEAELTSDRLLQKIKWLEENEQEILNNLTRFPVLDSVNIIYNLVNTIINQG